MRDHLKCLIEKATNEIARYNEIKDQIAKNLPL